MSARKLITDHLDLWTGAVTTRSTAGRGRNGKIELTGIKKLRELILELAVRGKLVEQDPNDEPASVLLERIAEEKARLVKEGKIKKLKNQPAVELEEVDFELPSSWLWVRLGSVGQVLGGGTPKSGEPSYWAEKEIAWLTPADLYGLNEKYIGSGKRDISRLGLEKSSAQLLPEGAVLFSSRAPIGYVAIAANELATNQGFKSCAPYIREVCQFVYYFLKRSARHIDASASGTTFKEVSGSKVASIPMPLPPLEEQLRIVEKVDELMALCDRLEQQVGDQLEAHEVLVDTLLDALTRSAEATEVAESWARIAEHFDTLFTTEASIEKLKQAVLHLAVTGRITKSHDKTVKHGLIFKKASQVEGFSSITDAVYPPHWMPSKLLDISEKIVDCPHSTPKWTESGLICVRTNQFSPGKLDVSSSRYVSEATYRERTARLEPEENDILYSREGGILGVACRVPPRIKLCLGQRMMLIRPSKEKIRSQYLEMVLNSPSVKKVAEKSTTGGAAPRVNMSVIKKYPVATPPLKEQDEIIERYEILILLCDQLKSSLGEARETRSHLAEAVVEQAVS